MPMPSRALSFVLLPALVFAPLISPLFSAPTARAEMAMVPPPPPRVPVQAIKLDVVFVIDATGSMADEIEQVKNHLWRTAQSVMNATPRPEVRFGIVVYRDRSDAEHTRVVPLTRDIESIHTALMGIRAIGGGDTPEDVDAGLTLAVREMAWARDAAHMVFLIGDAPAQSYGVDREALLAEARRQEIKIHTVQASGMDARGTAQFQTVAQATGGVAEVLTYTQEAQYAGREVTVMRRGRETWVSRAPLAPSERALSFEEQRARGLVVRDDAAAAAVEAEPSAYASTGAPRSRGRGASRSAAPMAAPAPADSDIGGIVAREARSAAEARGAAY